MSIIWKLNKYYNSDDPCLRNLTILICRQAYGWWHTVPQTQFLVYYCSLVCVCVCVWYWTIFTFVIIIVIIVIVGSWKPSSYYYSHLHTVLVLLFQHHFLLVEGGSFLRVQGNIKKSNSSRIFCCCSQTQLEFFS